jgi:ABC-type Mn2+/Zn2+ transport system permease subunit
MDFLTDPFAGGIGQRALAEVLVVGAVCGPLGVWVLLYRQAYAAESVSHGMLPGLVIAALAGLPLVLGALGGVLVAAAAIAAAGRDERIGSETGVAVAISALVGAGALLAVTADTPPRLQELLFGDLLGASAGDVAVASALGVAVIGALVLAHRRLSAAAFDSAAARSLGAPHLRWHLAVLVLLAVTTVAAAPGLGALLLVALILGPAAAALRLTVRLPAALTLAAVLGMAAGTAGLLLSHHAHTAAGASVALCAVAAWVVTLARPRGLGVP